MNSISDDALNRKTRSNLTTSTVVVCQCIRKFIHALIVGVSDHIETQPSDNFGRGGPYFQQRCRLLREPALCLDYLYGRTHSPYRGAMKLCSLSAL